MDSGQLIVDSGRLTMRNNIINHQPSIVNYNRQFIYMSLMYSCGLFVFRQDLRLVDNTTLIAACAQCEKLLPIFIFDKPILNQFQQPDARVGFLIETVFSLKEELQAMGSDLLILHGVSTELIPQLVQEY
jgi:deoxyribodipyrimidine photo-lyase